MRLQLEEKCFAGGDTPVLAGLELNLDSGEFIALLGPSGVGKTTLLRLLAGLDRDFRGVLGAAGEPALRTGFLFQEPRLMPWLSALENVALVVDGDQRRARDALAAVALADAEDLYPRELSGGMQRRVALARAMVHEPQLLLLDEPFVSLDQPSAEQLQDLLVDYWQREHPTVVLVSHNLDEALMLSDRLVFLGGRPATIVHEQPVDIPRPRRSAGQALLTLRRELLELHPQLLSGRR